MYLVQSIYVHSFLYILFREESDMYDLVESGKRLKRLREEKGLSQYELSDAVGLSRETIARHETAKRGLNGDNIDIYSNYYMVSSDYILYGKVQNNDERMTNIINMIENLTEEYKNMVIDMVEAMIRVLV